MLTRRWFSGQYWSEDPNFLVDVTPALRISDRVYTRKGRFCGKGEWKKDRRKSLAVFIAPRWAMWLLCESNSFESPMRAELARAPSSVPGDRFEINQRFRTVDLPPTSPLPLFFLSLFLFLWKICSFLPWDWRIVPYLIKSTDLIQSPSSHLIRKLTLRVNCSGISEISHVRAKIEI